jgi:hypothetical protein
MCPANTIIYWEIWKINYIFRLKIKPLSGFVYSLERQNFTTAIITYSDSDTKIGTSIIVV